MAVAYHLLPELRFTDSALYACLIVLVLLLGSRVYGGGRHLRGAGERLLIVGTSPLARLVIEEIARRPHRYALVGVVEDGSDLDRLVAARRPDRIVVAFADRRGRLPLSRLVESRAKGIRVEDVVETYENLTGKLALELMPPSRVIFSPEFGSSRVQPRFARALSLLVAVTGLIVLAPVMALIALAIKLDSRELHGERKADISLTDDADAGGAFGDPAGELGRGHSRFMHHALSRWASTVS